jgi:glycosyltransferase involved in cell wall biosynthesis
LKVLLANTFEIRGGTGRVASRLHNGFLAAGVDSHFFVQIATGDNPHLVTAKSKLARGMDVLRPTIDQIPLYLCAPGWRKQQFSSQWFPDSFLANVSPIQPDIINLHWICKGFVRIETLKKLKQPIVWTMHDMWPFTGGCHHSDACLRFEQSCGACPMLGGQHERDLSRWVWNRKVNAWKKLEFTVVSPSRWLAEQASRSSLFGGRRIEVIPNGVDTERYRPGDRNYVRQLFNFPLNKQLIMFGAADVSNTAKGLPDLKQALKRLIDMGWQDRVELVVVGASSHESLGDLPFKIHSLGRLSDDISLALVYGAVDLFVAPSIKESFGNMVMEAMACGTPCVAYKVGGVPDIIDHELNGYLATLHDIDSLASGINWVLEDISRWQILSSQARRKVESEFNLECLVKRYINLYTELIEQRKS